MPADFKRTIRNSMEELANLSVEVDAWLEQCELSPKIAFSVGLALEEILTNTIKYGYDDRGEHLIEVALSSRNNQVTLTTVDDGHHFDPLKAPEPDLDSPLEEREVGGLGIHITTKMMDSIDYRREGTRNILVMSVSEENAA